MVERTKYIPSFWTDCDDLVVTDDEGNEYHPHAGERVRFRRDIPWAVLDLHEGMPDAEYVAETVQILKRQILEWEWTDHHDQPMAQPGEPGFERALLDLDPWDRRWLMVNCWQAGRNPNE